MGAVTCKWIKKNIYIFLYWIYSLFSQRYFSENYYNRKKLRSVTIARTRVRFSLWNHAARQPGRIKFTYLFSIINIGYLIINKMKKKKNVIYIEHTIYLLNAYIWSYGRKKNNIGLYPDIPFKKYLRTPPPVNVYNYKRYIIYLNIMYKKKI